MKAVEKYFPVTQFTVSNKFQLFEYADEILKCDYSVGTCVSVELFFFSFAVQDGCVESKS